MIIIIVLFTLAKANSIFTKADKSILNYFATTNISGLASKWQTYLIPPSLCKQIENKAKQRFYFKDKVYLKKITLRQETYIALLDNVLGKSLPITFLSIYNQEGNLISNEVIAYRESYGGAIQSKKWLKQFHSDSLYSNKNYSSPIQGISGATISVHSISKGFLKNYLLVQSLLKEI